MKSDKLINAMNDIKDEYIEEAKEPRRHFSLKSYIKPICVAVACFGLLCILFPRQMGSKNQVNYTYESASEDTMYAQKSTDDYESSAKVVVYSNLSMETKNLDKVMEELDASISKYEGSTQTSSLSSYDTSRTYYITVRIPKNQLDDFVKDVQAMGNVTYYSTSQEDITDSYNQSAERLKSLQQEEKKVLEFYEQAKSVEELITVEQRLTEIQSEIHYLQQSVEDMDSRTSYTTISIDVTETNTLSSSGSFVSRIQYAFSNGWQNFINVMGAIVEFVVYYWIFILIGSIIGVIWYKKRK